jgi:hypothetical protein
VLHGWLGLPFPLAGGAAGGSLPGFVTAFLIALVVLPAKAPRIDDPLVAPGTRR